METPFPAYDGADDFVFVCYSHADAEAVYTELSWLHATGVNLWYDEGIRPGAEWTEELANAIANCSKFIFFGTANSVQSRHCRDEIQYAQNHDKEIVAVFADDIQLPPGMELMLGSTQAIIRSNLGQERYEQRLLTAIGSANDRDAPKSGPTRGAGPAPRAVLSTTPASTQTRPRSILGLAIFALIATVGLGVWFYSGRAAPEPDIEATSIAILPLQNQGGFDDDAYYPDSVSEDLLNRLVSIDDLVVVSRRASFAFRETAQAPLNLVEVAQKLRVRNLLSGTIRRGNGMLHISLELAEIVNGRPVTRWSERFQNRPSSDMLQIQAEVIGRIAAEFFPQGLTQDTQLRVERHSTNNKQAYDYYLQAQDILRKPLTNAGLDQAASLFNAAIELDPSFAWARAGLCVTHTRNYSRRGEYKDAQQACEELDGFADELFEVQVALGNYLVEIGDDDRAIAKLQSAIELNPNSADTKIALARALAARYNKTQEDLDQLRAQTAYLEAIDLEPTYWFAHHAYSIYLTATSRLEEAESQLEIALQLEPDNASSLNNLANIYYRVGKTEQARASRQRVLSFSPYNQRANSGLGIMYHYENDYLQAADHFKRALKNAPRDHSLWGRLGESYRLLDGAENLATDAFHKAIEIAQENQRFDPQDWELAGYLAVYFAYTGRFDEAQREMAKMFELNKSKDPITHYWAAQVFYEMGDVDNTFKELDLSLAHGFHKQKRFIANEPSLLPLRTQYPKRYQAMLDRY